MSKNGHREPLEASIRAEGYVCGTEDIRSPWRRVYGRRATSAAQKILGAYGGEYTGGGLHLRHRRY